MYSSAGKFEFSRSEGDKEKTDESIGKDLEKGEGRRGAGRSDGRDERASQRSL